jgi:hypothetical protein
VTAGDWAAVIVAIAALLVAAVAVPASTPYRGRVFAASGLLVVIALGIGAFTLLGRPDAETVDPPSPQPSTITEPDEETPTPAGRWLSAEETWVTLSLAPDGTFRREDPLSGDITGRYSIAGTIITFSINGQPAGTARWSASNQSLEWARSSQVTELYVRS